MGKGFFYQPSTIDYQPKNVPDESPPFSWLAHPGTHGTCAVPPQFQTLAGTFPAGCGSPLPFPSLLTPPDSHRLRLARGRVARYSCGSTPAGIVRPGGAGGQGWRLRRESGIRPRPVPGVLVEVRVERAKTGAAIPPSCRMPHPFSVPGVFCADACRRSPFHD